MELIDKDKVVAEIQRRKDYYENIEQIKPIYDSNIADCEELLSFLDTLEVKEVDLENSVKGRIDYPLIGADFPNIYPNYKELKNYCDKNGIKDEDKVKIIIIKEKEE